MCRLEQLGLGNFVIAAFDPEALSYCRGQALPCFAAFPVQDPTDEPMGSGSHDYGSKNFRRLPVTKLKSAQVSYN